MFLDLFYGLRKEGVPVGIQEWMTLVEAMRKGLHGASLPRFYHMARSCLVKSETYFDSYDRVFLRVFEGVEGSLDIEDEVLDWLRQAADTTKLSAEELEALERLSSDELMQRFLETLAEQTERHDGGGRWVGTGGRSPFGNSGQHPTGIRVGGQSRNRSAMKVAGERRFRDYRTDVALDTRQIRVALKRLRNLTREGLATELDLDETIDETCRNAGEIEFVFRPQRKNNVRVLLLMDAGGTMDPFFEPVSRLITALYEERGLRDLRAYYFHNCIYERVYRNGLMRESDAISTGDLLRSLDERWKVVIVGDAAMHPAEMFEPYGNISHHRATETTGISWLQKIAGHFERSVWVNPEDRPYWEGSMTCRVVQRLFPMFHLSVDGMAEAVTSLIGAKQ
ncbi:MAG: VWA domain-containing protein [Deltaproteobacteria bacterium]